MTIQQRRKAWLDKALQPYLEDPSRRSIAGDTCFYRGPGGRKCLIGQFIPDSKYSKEMEGHTLTVEGDVWDALPKMVVSLGGSFLRECQNLHDSNIYWTRTGLSESGNERLNYIIRKYCETV